MKIKWKKVLHYIKLAGETITAVAPVIKLILVAAGAFAVAMFVGDIKHANDTSEYDIAIKKHTQETQVALALVAQYKSEVTQLQNAANSITLQNSVLLQQVDVAKNQVHSNKQKATTFTIALRDSVNTVEDSLQVLLNIVPAKDSIITEQDVVISKQDTVINNLTIIIENKDLQIEKLQTSLTSLEKVAKTIPIYDSCKQKFFFCKINKPNRKTSFVSGIVIGVLTTGIILR